MVCSKLGLHGLQTQVLLSRQTAHAGWLAKLLGIAYIKRVHLV